LSSTINCTFTALLVGTITCPSNLYPEGIFHVVGISK